MAHIFHSINPNHILEHFVRHGLSGLKRKRVYGFTQSSIYSTHSGAMAHIFHSINPNHILEHFVRHGLSGLIRKRVRLGLVVT